MGPGPSSPPPSSDPMRPWDSDRGKLLSASPVHVFCCCCPDPGPAPRSLHGHCGLRRQRRWQPQPRGLSGRVCRASRPAAGSRRPHTGRRSGRCAAAQHPLAWGWVGGRAHAQQAPARSPALAGSRLDRLQGPQSPSGCMRGLSRRWAAAAARPPCPVPHTPMWALLH